MGNYRTIEKFLLDVPASDRPLALELLEQCSDKDLRDIKESVLLDHLVNTTSYRNLEDKFNRQLYLDYILNPGIDNELIVAWRKYLPESIPSELKQGIYAEPSRLVDYVYNNIMLDEDDNYYRTPISPVGVDKLKVADSQSRDLYIVALYRSLGIPARLEPGSKIPQYYFSDAWHDIIFPDKPGVSVHKARVSFVSEDKFPEPEYYVHFTLAKFEEGRYNTLEYDYNRRISDFPSDIALDPGHYMLVTGNRLSDSRILATLSFFDLAEDEQKTIKVTLRR